MVETEFGYHIMQLIERRGNTVKIRHILIKPVITQDDLDLAVQKLEDIRHDVLVDSLSFSRAVKRFGDDSVHKILCRT